MIRSILIILVLASSCWGQSSLNVMTYNIRYLNENDGENHWNNRRETIAKIVEEGNIDIVGFQEVVTQQKNDLSDLLPEYASYGVGRDDGIAAGEYCPIYYKKQRFELMDKGTFWLSKTPNVAGSKSWDSAITRIASWVKLKSKVNKQFELFFINTHFDHRGKEARCQSSKIIIENIRQHQGNLPVVLAGDFNCLIESEPMKILTGYDAGDQYMRTTREICKTLPVGPESTWNGFSEVADGRRIDFVLVRKFAVLRHETLAKRIGSTKRYPSDHLPIAVELSMPKESLETEK